LKRYIYILYWLGGANQTGKKSKHWRDGLFWAVTLYFVLFVPTFRLKIQPPSFSFRSWDWPNSIKTSYITHTSSSNPSFQHPTELIQSPWKWRQRVPLKRPNEKYYTMWKQETTIIWKITTVKTWKIESECVCLKGRDAV
jgi:hypothetical protein